MLKDKNGTEIKEGCIVKFKKPVWDANGNVSIVEAVKKVIRDEDGELFAQNYEEDCYDVPFKEMEIIS